MSPTSSTNPGGITCPHERGPGTALCLRCRAEANSASAGRQRRAIAKVGVGLASVLAALAFGGRLLASRGQGSSDPATATEQVAIAPSDSSPGMVQQAQAATPAPPPVRAPSDSMGGSPALAPVVPSGRTELHDGVYAERSAGEVTVHFDTPGSRTRRREKFEEVVRQTLPALYGPDAAALLAAIPQGRLLPEGNLVSELPTRGIKLPTSDGGSLTLWPATRPGQDGPLVVSYRVAVSPSE